MPTVSVILPAYNEGEVIGSVVQSLLAVAEPDWEIIIVDDGSSDGTADRAEAEGVRVIRHPYNKGNGAAVKTGLRAATGDVVCLMDADGQHDPTQIAALGDVHFRVSKHEGPGAPTAQIVRIEGQDRVEEIARMAGGESVTAATRRHAAELLAARTVPPTS